LEKATVSLIRYELGCFITANHPIRQPTLFHPRASPTSSPLSIPLCFPPAGPAQSKLKPCCLPCDFRFLATAPAPDGTVLPPKGRWASALPTVPVDLRPLLGVTAIQTDWVPAELVTGGGLGRGGGVGGGG